MTLVIREPFNNFTDIGWNNVTGFSIVAGGQTGTGAQGSGTAELTVTIPAPVRSTRYAYGFAYKPANFTVAHIVHQLRLSSVNNITINTNAAGAIEVRRGGVGGTVLATSAAGLITVGTFSYIEFAVTIADAGIFTLWVDSVVAIGPDFPADTAASPDGSLMDTYCFNNSTSGAVIFDNFYLLSGAGVTALGPQVVTVPFLWSAGSGPQSPFPQRRLRTRRTC